MRELKFRGIVKYNGLNYFSGNSITGCLIYNLDPHTVENVIREAWIREPLGNLANNIEIDVKTIVQYTGLKDKNEKEIYEGDILKDGIGNLKTCNIGEYRLDSFVNHDLTNTHLHYGVYFYAKKYKTSKISYPEKYQMLNEHMEIIGNIHENPELLNN